MDLLSGASEILKRTVNVVPALEVKADRLMPSILLTQKLFLC